MKSIFGSLIHLQVREKKYIYKKWVFITIIPTTISNFTGNSYNFYDKIKNINSVPLLLIILNMSLL